MRTIAIVLLLAASISFPLAAQSVAPPNATLLATIADSLMDDCSDPYSTAKKEKTCGWSIFVWLVAPDKIEYSFDAEDIDITDECNTVDGLTTPEIFSMIATATVARGVSLGFTPCPGSGSAQTAVWFNACVERTGSGGGTEFAVCGSGVNAMGFSFTCSSVVAIVCSGGGNCEAGCEETCGGEGLE